MEHSSSVVFIFQNSQYETIMCVKLVVSEAGHTQRQLVFSDIFRLRVVLLVECFENRVWFFFTPLYLGTSKTVALVIRGFIFQIAHMSNPIWDRHVCENYCVESWPYTNATGVFCFLDFVLLLSKFGVLSSVDVFLPSPYHCTSRRCCYLHFSVPGQEYRCFGSAFPLCQKSLKYVKSL